MVVAVDENHSMCWHTLEGISEAIARVMITMDGGSGGCAGFGVLRQPGTQQGGGDCGGEGRGEGGRYYTPYTA